MNKFKKHSIAIILTGIFIATTLLPAMNNTAQDSDHEEEIKESAAADNDMSVNQKTLNTQLINTIQDLLSTEKQKHYDTLIALLEARADIEATDQRNRTPLLLSTEPKNLHCDLVRTLLTHKANVNKACSSGNTPLFNILHYPETADKNHRAAMAKELIVHKANIHAYNHYGFSILEHAMSHGHHDIIKTLITLDIDIDSPCNYYRHTPLTMILLGNTHCPETYDASILKTVILAGAYLDRPDTSRMMHTPFDLITCPTYSHKKKTVIQALIQRYDFLESALVFKKYIQHHDLFNYLPIVDLVNLVGDYYMLSGHDEFIQYLNYKHIAQTNEQLIAQQALINRWLKQLRKKESRCSQCSCM